MRLAFRGGRTWIRDHEGRSGRRLKRQDLRLAAALKAGHAILAREGLSPLTPAIAPEAKAPVSAYDRKLCCLALLAPHLQRMILEGRQPEGLDIGSIIQADPPLAWADQETWLDGLRSARATG
jgi:hypothetical protein